MVIVHGVKAKVEPQLGPYQCSQCDFGHKWKHSLIKHKVWNRCPFYKVLEYCSHRKIHFRMLVRETSKLKEIKSLLLTGPHQQRLRDREQQIMV